MKETYAGYTTEDDYMNIYSDERKWINKIIRWAEERPDEVKIKFINEDGSLGARIPKTWFKIAPPRSSSFTDEQRQEIARRLSESRKRS